MWRTGNGTLTNGSLKVIIWQLRDTGSIPHSFWFDRLGKLASPCLTCSSGDRYLLELKKTTGIFSNEYRFLRIILSLSFSLLASMYFIRSSSLKKALWTQTAHTAPPPLSPLAPKIKKIRTFSSLSLQPKIYKKPLRQSISSHNYVYRRLHFRYFIQEMGCCRVFFFIILLGLYSVALVVTRPWDGAGSSLRGRTMLIQSLQHAPAEPSNHSSCSYTPTKGGGKCPTPHAVRGTATPLGRRSLP